MRNNASLAALSLVISMAVGMGSAQAHQSAQVTQIIINNINAEAQTIGAQINAFAASGELTSQQAAGFQAQLNQIASEAPMVATNPVMTQQVMNELTVLSAQITAALNTVATPAPCVLGPTNYGFYKKTEDRIQLEKDRIQAHQIQQRALEQSLKTQRHPNAAAPYGGARPGQPSHAQGQHPEEHR